MKFVLVLYLCSMLTGKCIEPQVPGYQFNTHYDCAFAGYALAQESLKMLSTDEYYGLERINQEKIAIRFECRELKGA
jgi:hypothetical protein